MSYFQCQAAPLVTCSAAQVGCWIHRVALMQIHHRASVLNTSSDKCLEYAEGAPRARILWKS
jgi:hypothetical protein